MTWRAAGGFTRWRCFGEIGNVASRRRDRLRRRRRSNGNEYVNFPRESATVCDFSVHCPGVTLERGEFGRRERRRARARARG